MIKLRKRFWVYLLFLVISGLSVGYARWTAAVMDQRSQARDRFENAPFFHPIPVWDGVTRWYVETHEISDPAKAANFKIDCLIGFGTAGLFGLLLFLFFTLYEMVWLWDKREKAAEQ